MLDAPMRLESQMQDYTRNLNASTRIGFTVSTTFLLNFITNGRS